jgi:hypothetical protein
MFETLERLNARMEAIEQKQTVTMKSAQHGVVPKSASDGGAKNAKKSAPKQGGTGRPANQSHQPKSASDGGWFRQEKKGKKRKATDASVDRKHPPKSAADGGGVSDEGMADKQDAAVGPVEQKKTQKPAAGGGNSNAKRAKKRDKPKKAKKVAKETERDKQTNANKGPVASRKANKPVSSDKQMKDKPVRDSEMSENGDFAQMCKGLFKMVQLKHHSVNWHSVPLSVEKRLKNVFDNIRPPMADETFLKEMESVYQRAMMSLQTAVSEHISRQLDSMTEAVSCLDNSDNQKAKIKVDRWLVQRLGRRLADQRRNEYLDEMIQLVGVFRKENAETEMDETVAIADTPEPTVTETLVTESVTTESVATKTKGKRLLNASPDCEKNKVQKLSQKVVDLTETDASDVEPEKSPVAKKACQDAPEEDSNFFLYTKCDEKEKQQWVIEPICESGILVLADSNMKAARSIPDGMEVHCLPGAALRHVVGALSRFPNSGTYDVVIQVGINDRNLTPWEIDDEILRLTQALKAVANIRTSVALGLSCSTSLPENEQGSINHFNAEMKKMMTQEHWIPPRHDVKIVQGDKWGIHHTPDTIDQILEDVQEFMNPFHRVAA